MHPGDKTMAMTFSELNALQPIAERELHQRGFSIAMNEPMYVGDFIFSEHHAYCAMLQSDGNFLVYQGNGPYDLGFKWPYEVGDNLCVWGMMLADVSNMRPKDFYSTNHRNVPFFAILQADGNFCVYNGTPGAWGPWVRDIQNGASTTGEYFATLADNGSFCIYHGTLANRGPLLWQSGGVELPDYASAVYVRNSSVSFACQVKVNWNNGDNLPGGRENQTTPWRMVNAGGDFANIELEPYFRDGSMRDGATCWVSVNPVLTGGGTDTPSFTFRSGEQIANFMVRGVPGALKFIGPVLCPVGSTVDFDNYW
jgi:hypothetical protein